MLANRDVSVSLRATSSLSDSTASNDDRFKAFGGQPQSWLTQSSGPRGIYILIPYVNRGLGLDHLCPPSHFTLP